MGRPKSGTHAVPTNERILNAAERIFSEHGYAGARLADIAAAADIRRPSLLYHFESKEVLYEAMVHRLFQRLLETLSGLMLEDAEFDQQIVKIGLAFEAFAEDNLAFGGIVIRDILDHRDPVPELLANGVVPVLDVVCAYIDSQGVKRGAESVVGTRASVLQFCINTMVRSAAGPLRSPLWGDEDHTELLIKRLFL
jgi:AcrR family transcriptional regulator